MRLFSISPKEKTVSSNQGYESSVYQTPELAPLAQQPEAQQRSNKDEQVKKLEFEDEQNDSDQENVVDSSEDMEKDVSAQNQSQNPFLSYEDLGEQAQNPFK